MNLKNILKGVRKAFSPVWSSRGTGGWLPMIKEPAAGSWQANRELSADTMATYHAIYAATTLIAGDISKLGLNLVKRDEHGIWQEIEHSAYSPVLRKPNSLMTRIQFVEAWILSLLQHGNTYVLKRRDRRNVVTEVFILDPTKVKVLVSEKGQVAYELQADNLIGLEGPILVPAEEIIHDRISPLFHHLVGVPPIVACALPVLTGHAIQTSSSWFFQNRGNPGGVLQAPGSVSDETVEQLRTYWKANFTGNKAGEVVVLADSLTYQPFSFDAQTAQLIEQLSWTAEVVASVFHIPGYKLGVGEIPTSGNIESENIRYFAEALQVRIENIELLIAEGLKLPVGMAVEFDTAGLYRLDTKSLIEAEALAVGSGVKTINEARKKLNLPPVPGADQPFLQQQMWPVQTLSERRDRPDDTLDVNRYFKTINRLRNLENA